MGIRSRLLGGGDASIARARRPQELAASLDAPPLQGLDWLDREPGSRAPRLYRLLVRLGEAFLVGICRLRIRVEGRELLPAGGYVAVCALHRSWIDPLLVIRALPIEPRVWFLGSGPTAFDRPWKERLLRRTGGILPVWRGGADVEVHVRAARAVVEQGGVLALFMEGAIGGPPDRTSRVRVGSAFLALRTGAPLEPIAVCGAEELYRGKRMALRMMPPTSPEQLLGDSWTGTPEPGSRDELRLARKLSAVISARIDAAVAELYPNTLGASDGARRWRWLTQLFR
jgi:1-acyl-sn-glycerol-3-phosphate acyltransferase